MRYELRLTAYDVLDQTNYTVRMGTRRELPDTGWLWETILAGHLDSIGETDPNRWTRQVLEEVSRAL